MLHEEPLKGAANHWAGAFLGLMNVPQTLTRTDCGWDVDGRSL